MRLIPLPELAVVLVIALVVLGLRTLREFSRLPFARRAGHVSQPREGHVDGSFGKALQGAKFWMAGDLGSDFSREQYDWAVIHFDPSVTKDRRDALAVIFPYLFPGQWGSFSIGPDGVVEWTRTANRVEARLDGGKTAEIVLHHATGMTTDPVIARNLKYEGAPRNDGFVLMPNEVEAYRAGDKPFEFKGTNGFVTTIDLSSTDFKKK
jgi:hypothetical protein